MQADCVIGSCNGAVGNSFYNFDQVSGPGPFCFKFEWDDGSRFSWCQIKNPIEHLNISSVVEDVHYTRKAVDSQFESGDVVRFRHSFGHFSRHFCRLLRHF